MRIIDKNTDFYDFYQGVYRDDSVTFDRTDSFVLTKNDLCEYLRFSRFAPTEKFNFLLLQVCHSFWLFSLEVTKLTDYDVPADYTIELVTAWKNYSKARQLEKLDIIRFDYDIRRTIGGYKGRREWCYDKNKIADRADTLAKAIDLNNYDVEESINSYEIYKDSHGSRTVIEKHIPLLKACGIGDWIDPLEIYLAFEEYFSLEKTSSERTESVGLTDKEKIENHGFNAKGSFRGK